MLISTPSCTVGVRSSGSRLDDARRVQAASFEFLTHMILFTALIVILVFSIR